MRVCRKVLDPHFKETEYGLHDRLSYGFHHRYHIVWVPKYRYKVLQGEIRERICTIIRQICSELGVEIISGVLSRDHVRMFVEIPPQIAVSKFMQRVKGRTSRKIQQEFSMLRKRYWARGYFCTKSG